MTQRGMEIRVGAVVVMAALIAVVGTMWFQRFRLHETRYSFDVRFTEVGGLVTGDPIHINGVELGKVEAIAPQLGRVVVRMGIRQGIAVPQDSRIVLKSIGIMGERFVEITQGRSRDMLAPGDTVDGVFLMGMSEVMGSAGDIIADVRAAVAQLRDVSAALNEGGRLAATMKNLAEASEAVRALTAGDDPRLIDAVDRLSHVSMLLDSLLSRHYTSIDSSLLAFERAGGRIEGVVDNLGSVSESLQQISSALQSGEGTAGRLIYDDTLVRHLESTVQRVDSLITDMKQHPGRYVTFKLF